MLTKEYEVLTYLYHDNQTSQRKIAFRTGLSLGAVNLLLKKMARKGLLKIEKLNPRTVRYILTPRGLQEKARLTYNYIRQSYHQIMEVNQVVDALLQEKSSGGKLVEVILYGPADEICAILQQHLAFSSVQVRFLNEMVSPEILAAAEPDHLILTWRQEEEKKLTGYNRSFNIMSLI
ncbi:MAG TPA: winged helix-turn-helix transcriptional regulator [Candidatus Limnocylindrales bacterium]|nr:winged helix-turn-helix transcriptional regulator [Candidatus Limnocylindrales bacterium]